MRWRYPEARRFNVEIAAFGVAVSRLDQNTHLATFVDLIIQDIMDHDALSLISTQLTTDFPELAHLS